MKFGGHETFYIRPEWLTAGLHLLDEQPDTSWSTNAASDAMGVGRNMAKSIGWWLNMTGLSTRAAPREPLQISSFGRVILAHDPYFSALATWWFIHLALIFGTSGISVPANDRIFSWFFREFRQTRFRRSSLIETLRAHLATEPGKTPSEKSLHRDVSVLLQTYATPVPAPLVDPEDQTCCDLRYLDLLVYRTRADTFERRAPISKFPAVIPPHALAAGLGALGPRSSPNLSGRSDLALTHDGPAWSLARSLNLDINAFIDRVETAAKALGPDLLAIRYLAGDKVASVINMPFDHWAKACLESPTTGEHA